jgi:hypothetical protein
MLANERESAREVLLWLVSASGTTLARQMYWIRATAILTCQRDVLVLCVCMCVCISLSALISLLVFLYVSECLRRAKGLIILSDGSERAAERAKSTLLSLYLFAT